MNKAMKPLHRITRRQAFKMSMGLAGAALTSPRWLHNSFGATLPSAPVAWQMRRL